MDWKTAVLQTFPNMSEAYRKGLSFGALENELRVAGILDNPLRIAAFFASIGVESGHMRLYRENLNYTKRQIEAVFGVGKHSAAITSAQAERLAGNPVDLAERVYGLGNPTKARELGNTAAGDAYAYRGLGPFQHTGKTAITDLMERLGLTNIADLAAPKNIFSGAIIFWTECGLNTYADQNDTRNIRRRVNGGYNGYSEFLSIYTRIVGLLAPGKTSADLAVPDGATADLQHALNRLGANLVVDGKYGEKTSEAVRQFQRQNGLTVDGIAGDATWGVIRLRLNGNSVAEPPAVPVVTDQGMQATGGASIGLGAAGEVVMTTARELTGMGLDSPLLTVIPSILMLVGLGMIIWPIIKRQ